MKEIEISNCVEKVFETPTDDYSIWFGYYNYDALNSNHTRLLCNRIREDAISPQKDISVEVGYYEISKTEWHHIGFSDSWNWQQGCMAQWLNDDEVIYNTSEHGHHISLIYNIRLKTTRKINWAIYGITPDRTRSISLCMERAHWCRAYHYQSVADKKYEGRVLESDGIFEIDLINNTRKRIISIDDIVNYDYIDDFESKKHWLEHVMISPTGNRFVFLHRFSTCNNVYDYGTRVFIADIDGSNLQIINNWENVDWSHFGWDTDNAFAIYSYEKGRYRNVVPFSKIVCERPINIGNLFKRLAMSIVFRLPSNISKRISGKKSYYQYYTIDKGGKFVLDKLFSNNEFNLDGHPTFANSNFMITDTYPDKYGNNNSYLYKVETREIIKLGAFNEPLRNTPAACDLHPKLSKDGNYVTIDTTYTGKHSIVVLKINWNKI